MGITIIINQKQYMEKKKDRKAIGFIKENKGVINLSGLAREIEMDVHNFCRFVNSYTVNSVGNCGFTDENYSKLVKKLRPLGYRSKR